MFTHTKIYTWFKVYRRELLLGLLVGVLGCVLENQYLYQAHFQQARRVPPSTLHVSQQHEAAPGEPTIILEGALNEFSSSSIISQSKPSSRSQASSPRTQESDAIASSAPLSSAASSIPLLSSSTSSTPPHDDFPAFVRTMHPVARVANWGAMRTPAEWNRPYREMTDSDFVSIPPYNLAELTIPVSTLSENFSPENIRILTEKLYYSTRFFAAYDLDATEFSGTHAGIDLKIPLGTPVGTIAGGRVQTVLNDDRLGLHVIVEHRHPTDGTFFSIYGHLESAAVRGGQDLEPGQRIGTIGMTGETSAPHLHVQIDRAQPNEGPIHQPYHPAAMPSASAAANFTVHPLQFIQTYQATVAASGSR